eukprot:tig00000741_g3827.t1
MDAFRSRCTCTRGASGGRGGPAVDAMAARLALAAVVLMLAFHGASGGGGHGGGAKEIKFVAKEINHAALDQAKVQRALAKLVNDCSVQWMSALGEAHADHDDHDDHGVDSKLPAGGAHDDHDDHGAATNGKKADDHDDHDEHGELEGAHAAPANGTASLVSSGAEANGTAGAGDHKEEGHHEEEGHGHEEESPGGTTRRRSRRLQQALAFTPPVREPLHELLVGCTSGRLMCDTGRDAAGDAFLSPLSCECMEEEDVCAPTENEEPYDMAIHVAAIFILLAVSVLGSGYPVLAYYKPRLALPPLAMRALAVFGAGVILATALIHMMGPGYELLKSPCVSTMWDEYESWGGLFTLIGILLILIVELVVARYMPHSHLGAHAHGHGHGHGHGPGLEMANGNGHTHSMVHLGKPGQPDVVVAMAAGAQWRPAGADLERQRPQQERGGGGKILGLIPAPKGPALVSLAVTEEQRRRRVGLVGLEIAIAAHSVVIGIRAPEPALPTAAEIHYKPLLGISRENFTSLLIAIALHQFFEGIALSSAVLGAGIVRGWALPLLTIVPYGLATPAGVAIGVGIHSSYQGNSTTRVLVEGIIECIAGGILLYAALVELIVPAFENTDREPKRVVLALVGALVLGAAVMAVLGRWA